MADGNKHTLGQRLGCKQGILGVPAQRRDKPTLFYSFKWLEVSRIKSADVVQKVAATKVNVTSKRIGFEYLMWGRG